MVDSDRSESDISEEVNRNWNFLFSRKVMIKTLLKIDEISTMQKSV